MRWLEVVLYGWKPCTVTAQFSCYRCCAVAGTDVRTAYGIRVWAGFFEVGWNLAPPLPHPNYKPAASHGSQLPASTNQPAISLTSFYNNLSTFNG